jgi:hypothetical protein
MEPFAFHQKIKVFWFFFSKKNRFLPCYVLKEASKPFFFEKKNQKTFVLLPRHSDW